MTVKKPVYLWKFLHVGLKSDKGDCVWKIGKWKKKKAVDICKKGFHGSEKIVDALHFVKGEILAKVEVKGKSEIEDDKQCWSEMRVIEAYKWTKEESVRLAVFAARRALPAFEKEYPKDDRPKKAIEAAEAWIKKPTASAAMSAMSAANAMSAAMSAMSAMNAAWSAENAENAVSAAWSAAMSAENAVSAAMSAAMNAAWSAVWSAASAMSAAWSAENAASAAMSATWSAASATIQTFLLSRIKQMRKIHRK